MRNTTQLSVRAFFVESVLANYEHFITNYIGVDFGEGKDTRFAEAAAMSMLHLGDRLFSLVGGFDGGGFANATEYRRSHFKRCQPYAIVSDVALAAKHDKVGRGEGFVAASDALAMQIAVDRYEDDDGVYFRYRKLLELTLANNESADFGWTLFATIEYLSKVLVTLRVIPGVPELRKPLPMFAPRHEVGRIRKFRQTGMVGEHVQYGHRVFFYRANERRLTPMRADEKMGASAEIEFEAVIRESVFPQSECR